MTAAPLAARELAALRRVAAVLLPGDDAAPAASTLPDLDDLLQRAAAAIGREIDDLRRALALVGAEADRLVLERLARDEPQAFELVSTVVAGAYFMAPAALEAIGYLPGERVAPPFDLIADELATGILDPVQARGPRVRMP